MVCTAFIERYNSRIPVYSRIWTVHIRTRPFFENKEQFFYPKLFRIKTITFEPATSSGQF